jgi:hypothetical protein
VADRGSLRNRFRALMCAAGIGALALSGTALGAPPELVAPVDDGLATTLRPTFTWTHGGPSATTSGYNVMVDGVGVVATLARPPAAGSGPFNVVSAVDLPDDATLSWSVQALGTAPNPEDSGKFTLRTSSPPTLPPSILGGPAGPTNQTVPVFNWGGTRANSVWTLLGSDGAALQTGGVGSGNGSAQLTALGDGAYTFRVLQRSSQGAESPAATRAFAVDTQNPAILLITAVPSFPTLNASPTFAWAGVEPAAKVAWKVIGVGGNTVRGPVVTAAASSRVGPLPHGSFLFQVRQTDTAGNSSEWRSEPFAVAPGATVAGGPRLPSHNARALTPGLGARISTPRPLLRWKAGARARLYNVQIFRVAARGRLAKIRSVFPRGNRFRLSNKRKLPRGSCYVWRVWPYLGRSFTKKPLGVSNFCVTKPRKP